MATPVEQFEGKYEILEKIAEGGMGAVYKVRHRLLDVVRVIKVMRPQIEAQKGTKERFLREARLAIKMRHPNIAQLDDFSMDDDGNAFIVMEYIDGITLQEYLQRFGPPPIELTLEVIRQSLNALGYLHRKHVIHRDISPDNLMVGADENDECQVKLIDLGIAKALQADAAGLTATGMFVGKVRYASPEHFRTEEGVQIDRWSDLYSLGLVLYELLTGKHPIVGDSFSTLIAGHLFRPPMDFATSDPEGKVPEDLREVVLKSLAKAPEERFQKASEFRDALGPMRQRFMLTQEIFDESFRLRRQDMPTMRLQRPGSTQDRLDAEFRSSRGTPAPEGMTSSETAIETGRTLTPAGGTAGAERERAVAEQSAALVQAAQRLLQLGLYKEARVQIRSVLERDAANKEAAELLTELEAREAREQALEGVAQSVAAHLEAGELEQAAGALQAAVDEHGGDERLQVLQQRVEAERQRLRDEEVAALLMEVDALAAEGEFDEALERAARAQSLDPQRDELERRVAEIEAARTAREEAEKRAAEVAELQGELAAALEKSDFQEALDLALRALELDPGNEELAARRDEAQRALQAHEAEEAKLAALAAAVKAVEAELAAGRPVKAREALEAARAELGPDDQLDDLLLRVTEAETEARDREVEALVREAQSLLADGKFKSAIKRLEKGLTIAPDNTGIQAQLADSKEAFARHERALRVSKLAAQVSEQIEAGQLEEAIRAVEEALETEGEHDELSELLERAKALLSLAEVERQAADSEAKVEAAETEASEIDAGEAEAADAEAAPEAEELEGETGPLETDARITDQLPRVEEEAAEAESTAPLQRPEPAGPPAQPERRAPDLAPASSSAARAAGVEKPTFSKLWLAVALGAVLVLVGGLWLLRGGGDTEPAGGAAPSILVIKAVPWAQVTAVTDSAGTAFPVPSESYTPCRLELPPGSYRVTLAAPQNGEPREIAVELEAGSPTVVLEEFGELDARAFLAGLGVP